MLEKTKPHLGNSYFLNIHGCLRQANSWAGAGHEIVSNQFEITFRLHEIALFVPLQSPKRPTSRFMLETTSEANSILVQRLVGGESMPLVVIDKNSGTIVSYAPHGCNLLHSEGIQPNFVRASTDNDKGGMELALEFLFPRLLFIRNAFRLLRGTKDFSYWSHWRNVGLDGVEMPKVSSARIRIADDSNGEKVHIIALCSIHSPDGQIELFRVKLHYNIFADGRVRIANHVMPLPPIQVITSLPRVGLSMQLDPSLHRIQYFGRGPHENYPDRKSSAFYGVFETSPKNMAYNQYIVPGENGSRSDCEYISFRSKHGNGFCVVETKADGAISPFCCSAQLHSISELHKATHTCDLQKREDGEYPIHVNIDHKLMGLGGDNRYGKHNVIGG
jgi:beta-galactosidase